MNDQEMQTALLQSEDFLKSLGKKLNLTKADTVTQATGLLWYDLRPVVQLLYPFKELIPRISALPRVPANGGNAYRWKRITAVNVNKLSIGVSEGNRGGIIAINVQEQTASYKTMGLESSATFESRLGGQNLTPEVLGTAVQSTLRSVMIGEEQTLILGNAAMALGTTPTPSLVASGAGSALAAAAHYVNCIALSGLGWLNSSVAGGVVGAISRTNADASVDSFGGGAAAPSAQATVTPTVGQIITATVTPVTGAVGYAWYIGTTTGQARLAGITRANTVIFSAAVPGATQLITAITGDNSQNALLPDGILTQIFGSVFGSAPSLAMSTNPNLPSGVTVASSGALVYRMASANTGLTISGTNITEWDALLQAAYDQYKLGYSRILMSAQDVGAFMGLMIGQNAANAFRIMFDAESVTGRIVAGRRITSYLNKFMGNTLDVEVHPFVPPGTQIFWSDNVPYELSGAPNLLEAHVRQDYYQIQWPFRTRKYEFGCYVDEVFACYFLPAFGVVHNVNLPAGTPTI